MSMQREDSSAIHDDNDLDTKTNVLEDNDENFLNCTTLSNYGPCCTNGCQYCRPNCHEDSDGVNYL